MKIIIRKATIKDIENLVRNRIDFQHELGGHPTVEFEKITRDYLNKHFSDNSLICYIGTYDGQIVASVMFCLYTFIPTIGNITGKAGTVFNVYTRKEFRRQGLATKLIRCGIDEAKRLGTGELFLEAQDAGRSVYENLNFKVFHRGMHLDLLEQDSSKAEI